MTANRTCPKCGKANRLVGIEPHDKFINLDLWTFECTTCGEVAVLSQLTPTTTSTEDIAQAS